MHIVFANQWYPPDSHGGVAAHNSNIAKALVQRGHEVTVIAQKRASDPVHCIQDGVNVIRIVGPNLHRLRRIPLIGRQYRFVQSLLYSRIVCRRLSDLNNSKPVDAVEFADINAEGFYYHERMTRVMMVRCHTPSFVLALHYSEQELPYDPKMLGWAEKHVIDRADVITTPSHNMAETIALDCQIPLERFLPIPNAVDTNLWAPPARKTISDTVTVLFVGRMERAKGIDVLVEAIPKVLESCDHVRFVFIGGDRPRTDGSSTRALVEQILDKYIAAGLVEIRGSVRESELLRAYHEADIAVIPSVLYESFSYTVAQAMSCGLAVIASGMGGIPETLDYGSCGVLVNPGEVEMLVKAIVEVSANAVYRQSLGRAARAHAVRYFASDSLARQYEDILNKILS